MATITDVDSKAEYDALDATDKQDIRDDVTDLSSTGFAQMSDAKLDRAIKGAIADATSIYTDRFARMPTLDGDAEEFRLNLAAHKATIAEGGEAQSESNSGGNVSYNTVTGDAVDRLQQTRYGREAADHVRDRQGLGLYRSW